MQCVLVDDFVKSSVCMLIGTSLFLPVLLSSSLGTMTFFLGTISLRPFLFGKEVHLSPFFRFHLEVIPYDSCLALSPLLHLE